jgi:pimeloyl-ACP methyl ester carboxylesterase
VDEAFGTHSVPLGQIRVPIEIWHGEDDRLVSPQASRILAGALPGATTHFVPREGHLLLAGNYAKDALQSALPADAAPLRRQRPRRPGTPQLRPRYGGRVTASSR